MSTRTNNGPLSGPFSRRAGDAIEVSPAVMHLAQTQVRALLESSPSFYELPPEKRERMRGDLEKIASYTAALVQDEWAASEKLGQRPVVHQRTTVTMPGPEPAAQAAAAPPPKLPVAALAKKGPASDEFSPRAASQVAQITRDTLNAIAFPTFVADLIKGTFQAIVDASIQQMEAYGNLLANVAKTVDQFMADNISDNNARDYLAASNPGHFKVEVGENGARVRAREGADELPKPNFKDTYGLNEDVDLDDDAIEEKLVPAARRQLARSRQQLLSTMVLMGINRIVVTSGRINAKMGFRIDARDTGHVQTASQFDWKNETTASAGGGLAGWLTGGPKVQTKNTVAYVSSTKKDSSDELDVTASLTGEVDLKFKSDYFPMERFANPQLMALIQGHTPNPAANTPVTGSNQPQQQGGGQQQNP
jgi:hypothetical protein